MPHVATADARSATTRLGASASDQAPLPQLNRYRGTRTRFGLCLRCLPAPTPEPAEADRHRLATPSLASANC